MTWGFHIYYTFRISLHLFKKKSIKKGQFYLHCPLGHRHVQPIQNDVRVLFRAVLFVRSSHAHRMLASGGHRWLLRHQLASAGCHFNGFRGAVPSIESDVRIGYIVTHDIHDSYAAIYGILRKKKYIVICNNWQLNNIWYIYINIIHIFIALTLKQKKNV